MRTGSLLLLSALYAAALASSVTLARSETFPRLDPGSYDVRMQIKGKDGAADIPFGAMFRLAIPDQGSLELTEQPTTNPGNSFGKPFVGIMARGQLKFGGTKPEGDTLVSHHFVGGVESAKLASGTFVEIRDGEIVRSGTWTFTRRDDPGDR